MYEYNNVQYEVWYPIFILLQFSMSRFQRFVNKELIPRELQVNGVIPDWCVLSGLLQKYCKF